MRSALLVLACWSPCAAAGLLGCSSRPLSETGAGASAGAGAPSASGRGGADTGSGGAGGAGASGTAAVCSSRPDGRLTLVGQRGSKLVFVYGDGSSRTADGPGEKVIATERNGWVAAYDYASTTTWHVQLFDASGTLRAESRGDIPPGPSTPGWGVSGLTILSDGTTSVGRGLPSRGLVLRPDGGVLMRPYFSTEPDAAGWVGTIIEGDPRILGTPVMLNVNTGETRKLTYLPSTDGWAPIVSGARRLYLAEMAGGAVLVDESPNDIQVQPLPGFARKALEIETVPTSAGGVAASVALWDSGRQRLPLWLYDVGTRTLASALPDGTVPAAAAGTEAGTLVLVSTGGVRSWAVNVETGDLFDYRGGLALRPTRTPAGGAPDWTLMNDNQKRLYRYDRRNAKLEDLQVTGDFWLSGQRALVSQGGLPRAVVDVSSGRVASIAGDGVPAAAGASTSGRWAVGFVPPASPAVGLTVPAWRVDLETAELRAFPAVDAGQTLLSGLAGPIYWNNGSILADGSLGLFLYDGVSARLHVGAPDVPWRPVGRSVRMAETIAWVWGAAAFAVAAEETCDCYGPIPTSTWNPVPDDTHDVLSGTSLQFLAPDGTDLSPPTTNESLGSLGTYADLAHSCALAVSDAGDYAVYDLAVGARHALGHFDWLMWVSHAP